MKKRTKLIIAALVGMLSAVLFCVTVLYLCHCIVASLRWQWLDVNESFIYKLCDRYGHPDIVIYSAFIGAFIGVFIEASEKT